MFASILLAVDLILVFMMETRGKKVYIFLSSSGLKIDHMNGGSVAEVILPSGMKSEPCIMLLAFQC